MFNTQQDSMLEQLFADTALNDSNKDVQPPAGEQWEVELILVEFIATATAGNRTIQFELLVSGTPITTPFLYKDDNLAATSTRRLVVSRHSGAKGTSGALGDTTFVPLSCPVLNDTIGLRIRDSAAIDAAADDMKIYVFGYKSRI